MPTSSVGTINKSRQRGVTLIEMLIVLTLTALVAGLTYPSVNSGLTSLRLRSAADEISGFLNTAEDRADRHQQAVEIVISPQENVMTAHTQGEASTQRLELSQPIHIVTVRPALPNVAQGTNPDRSFLIYPGGTAPRIGIEIAASDGRRRLVTLDPLSGFPHIEALNP